METLSRAWAASAPVLALLTAVLLVVNILTRRIPEATMKALEVRAPRVANALRLCRALGPDVDKGLRVLFALLTGRPWAVPVALAAALEDPPPRDPPPPPPALMALLVLALVGCSASAVQTQSLAADEAAKAWNTVVLPSMGDAFRLEQRAALDDACPSRCAPEVARAAVVPVRLRWEPVWIAAESVKRDQDAWRTELEVCRHQAPDAGDCMVSVARASLRLVGSVRELRCVLRTAGHPELDTFPGVAVCGEVRDAG